MARNFRLWQNLATVSLLKPAADAAGRTSAYVSLANAHKATVMFYVNQGNAATILISVLQATDNLGTGAKAIAAAPIAVNLDTDTVPADQMTMVAAAAAYTTDVGTKTKLVMIEIDPIESMDLANRFNHIAVSTGASNSANITAAVVVLGPLRFAQQNPPTTNV